MSNLNSPQQQVMDTGILWSGFNCLLQMPTGSGKTWLAEQAIKKTLDQGKRAIYLTPLRALAEELFNRWKMSFSQHPVGVFTGEFVGRRKLPVPFEKASLLIMTPERLDCCTRNWRSHWAWIPDVNLLVADELHLLGDPSRGPRLEGALLRFSRLNPFASVLGLSATLGNRRELAKWLDAIEFSSTWRAIPLEWSVVRFRKAVEKPALTANEIFRCIRGGGKSLVFVQSRRRAEQLAAYLAERGIRSAYHHAGLQHPRRSQIENEYRQGEMDALVATGTLEMGLNLPVRQVILYDLQEFNGLTFEPLSVIKVWQRAGRAGRPGLDKCGEVVLIAPSWEKGMDCYLNGRFEPVGSGMSNPKALSEQIIAEVASGLSRSMSQLSCVFSTSLAATQGRILNVPKAVNDMIMSNMLVIAGQTSQETSCNHMLKVTRLGRIASRQLLAPDTILYMQRLLEKSSAKNLLFLDLLIITVATGDCEPCIPADYEELDHLAHMMGRERSRLLQGSKTQIENRVELGGRRLLAVIKTALIARSWTRESNEESVAAEFGCYPFEIHRLRESLVRLLTALTAVICIAERGHDRCEENLGTLYGKREVRLEDRSIALTQMIKCGVDEEIVSLTLVPGIGGATARRLHLAGISDIESLACAELSELSSVGGLSPKRAQKWIEQALEIIDTRSAFHYREEGPPLNVHPPNWPEGIDPYRLRRALDLEVRSYSGCSCLVSGGLEPHLVEYPAMDTGTCDCLDFAKGHLCKHILAVRLKRGDVKLQRLVRRLERTHHISETLDLLDLWFEGGGTRGGKP